MDRSLVRKRWPRNRILFSAAAVVLLVAASYAVATTWIDSRQRLDAGQLTISVVTRGPFREYIPVTGSVLPLETFHLEAVEGGRVEQIFAEVGRYVQKGDPLLRLANTDLQLDVMYREALTYEQINNAQNRRLNIEQNSIAVRAQLADVEYNVARILRLHDRDSALAAKSLISSQDFHQTVDEYQYWLRRLALATANVRQDSLLRLNQLIQLEASIQRLEKNLELVKQGSDNLVVRAPIGGVLTSLNVEIGQSKRPGERLGQIDVLDSVKVRAAIDEFYIGRVTLGRTGELDLEGRRYDLRIAKISPEVQNGRFEVELVFDGAMPEGVRRGQTLQVRLELGELTEAVLLPRGGFFQATGGRWIYVVDTLANIATRRSVSLGRQNPLVFEVLDGLAPGEHVVTSGYEGIGNVSHLVLR